MGAGAPAGVAHDGTRTVRSAGMTGTIDLAQRVHCRWTDASAGDLGYGPGDSAGTGALPGVAGLDPALVGGSRPAWLGQVHGAGTVVVPTGASGARGEGDALVAGPPVPDRPVPCLCVLTADCASIALAGDDGSYAAVHAGWRGLLAGVVDAAADRLRSGGAQRIVGALGPCIHAECYEFSPVDLDRLAGAFGDGVRARTAGGRPALDLPAAVAVSLARAGISQVGGVDACTACQGRYFSHRARGDVARQALLVWGGP